MSVERLIVYGDGEAARKAVKTKEKDRECLSERFSMK